MSKQTQRECKNYSLREYLMTDVFFEDNPFVGINRFRFIGYNLSLGYFFRHPFVFTSDAKLNKRLKKRIIIYFFLLFKYEPEDFIVVADSGLMNNDNIADLEANGYKYIIGAKIKNESGKIQVWILEQPKTDCQMVEYDKGNGQRL